MTQRVDAAIVGGGPAGALVARGLAQRGWRVMLIERGDRYRNKTCGHCLAPRALPHLRELGLLDRVRTIANGGTRRVRVHGDNGSCICASTSTHAEAEGRGNEGLIVPRDRFDQLLRDDAERSGARVWHRAAARVVRIERDRAHLRVRKGSESTDIDCQVLIGADGVGSSVARTAGLAGACAAGRKFGFSMELAPDAVNMEAIERGTIEMFLVPGGYLGMVRKDDGHVHAAALIASREGGTRLDPSLFVARVEGRHPAIGEIGQGVAHEHSAGRFVAVGPMPWRPRGICVDNVALVGDAAGYIEPFTGEGMSWAMHSAILLMKAVDSNNGAWSGDVADMYAHMWQVEIQKRQRICRWLSAGLERPVISRWMLRAGRAMPMLAQRLVREVVRT